MKKTLKWGGIALAVVFIGMQFIRPDRTNPPIDPSMTIQAKLAIPSEVENILRRSCYDCHSHETRWPWYSHVAPAMWLVARDVSEGRSKLNFSHWDYRMIRAVGRLDQIAHEIHDGEMPLPAYLLLHPSARLTESDKNTIYDWIDEAREVILSDTTSVY